MHACQFQASQGPRDLSPVGHGRITQVPRSCTYRRSKGLAQELVNVGRVNQRISSSIWTTPQLWIGGQFGTSVRRK